MRIAYLYDRDPTEGLDMDCEKTFADWKGTDRAELTSMINQSGVRKGDTLCIRAYSELGAGREADRIRAMIEAKGVTIEVHPNPKKKLTLGRRPQVKPTPDQKKHLCSLWYSPAPLQHVLRRASEIMDADVNRNHMNYWCGPRSSKVKK